MIACSRCGGALPESLLTAVGATPCPTCGVELEVAVFPALFEKKLAGEQARAVLSAEDAACFHHPESRAVAVCDVCGRFLCKLCELDLDDRILCPGCLDSGREKGELTALENRRLLHDSVALALAVYPMFIFYFTLVTAPIAIYLCFRHWKSPGSLLPRSKVRFVVAGGLALLQLLGWVGIGFGIWWAATQTTPA